MLLLHSSFHQGPVDARIASMKQNMLVYLNSGHDVATPSEMKDAIEAFTGFETIIYFMQLIFNSSKFHFRCEGNKSGSVENQQRAREGAEGQKKHHRHIKNV